MICSFEAVFSFAQLEVTGEQPTFNYDLRGSVHKPKTDLKHNLMTYSMSGCQSI